MLNYAVTRNGDQIGRSTIRLHRADSATRAEITTAIEVKLAFITVYRFVQHETEQWTDGKLTAMAATTDDNGTVHKVAARRQGDTLTVEADGKVSVVDPSVIPASLWNAVLVEKTMALNPNDGTLAPLSVVDRGEERLVLKGRATPVHHYSIRTTFPQDVWYDADRRLVQVELRGSDGSKIQYRLG